MNYPCLCERQRGSLIPDVGPGPRQTVPNRFRRGKNELLVGECDSINAAVASGVLLFEMASQRVIQSLSCGS
jgi:hypothetical protein